jgi:citrate synthase
MAFSGAKTALKTRIAELIPQKQAEIKEVKAKYGSKILGTCTVEQVPLHLYS